MTDHSNLKAKAEAAGAGNRMAINVDDLLALFAELTTIKAQVDGAFNEGVEAAALWCGKEASRMFMKDGLSDERDAILKAYHAIKELSRPTKPTEPKDQSHE